VAVAGVALLVLSQLVWWTEPLGLFHGLEWATPDLVWRVSSSRPIVALSFDDGPHPLHTPQVLAVLAHYDAHATFFLIGERALAHPEVVQAIKARGHEVGNHYWHEGISLGDGPSVFVARLEQAERAIGLSVAPKLFRPPSGLAWPWQLRMARERGYTCVLGSAYPHDPDHPPVGYIQWLIEKNLVPGAIVILHDGIPDPRRSIQALPHVLATGHHRGLCFVTIGELLRDR
jgi:peptidoglycan/xylan/chitin deacetylase (PgdA/CDA1 family)